MENIHGRRLLLKARNTPIILSSTVHVILDNQNSNADQKFNLKRILTNKNYTHAHNVNSWFAVLQYSVQTRMPVFYNKKISHY
jgi:hypothetical protein